jgi:hypothetical protein
MAMSEDRGTIQKRVDGANWKRNMIWKYLSTVCGSHLKHEELVSIIELATKRLRTRFDRDAGRRNIVKIKWFAENWGVLELLLSNIVLEQEL